MEIDSHTISMKISYRKYIITMIISFVIIYLVMF